MENDLIYYILRNRRRQLFYSSLRDSEIGDWNDYYHGASESLK